MRMTDFEKIKAYYSAFDEQHRLEKADGRLEFDCSMNLILENLGSSDRILDLGGGAGKYSIELAKLGFKVTLADLSENLLEKAKLHIDENHIPALQGIDVVNAVDLGLYQSESFDAVLLLGPLYHLLEENERRQCVSEVNRVLKPDGIVFASFIPYLSGVAGIISRASCFSNQVDLDNLSNVFLTGRFNNNANRGFQEGYYPKSSEIERLFSDNHFSKVLLRSIRGFGYNREEKLYELFASDPALYEKIIELINETATDPAIIETCGHAMYVGRKA